MTSSRQLDLGARLLPIAALCPLLIAAAVLARNSSVAGNPTVHALAQLLSGVFMLFCGAMILKQKAETGKNALIVMGLGVLGAAVLDLCHGILVVPSFRPATLAEVVPWGWFPSRVFLPVMLCVSLLIDRYEQDHGETGIKLLLAVCALAGCFVAGSCLFFLLLPVPLPQAYFPDSFVSRPAEYVPALLFSVALIGFLYKGEWRRNIFEFNLILAIIVSIVVHIVFMPYAQSNFDSFFAAAIVSKMVSYAFIMVGLVLQARDSMKRETKGEKLRHEAIVAMASDGIITTDSMGAIDSFNSAAERLFGYSVDEVLGENIGMLMPDPYRSEYDNYLKHYRETGDAGIISKTRELAGQHKNGSTFPMELAMSEIRFSDTRLFMGILRDISARKQYLDELETARNDADEANQAKSAFLATMSHEIRTPLNGVIGMSEVLQQSGLQDGQTEMAGLIRQSAFSLLDIVEDILDLSKIEAGKLEIDLTPIAVANVTESVCAMLLGLAEKSEVELTLFTDPGIPQYLLGDGQRLRQVLTNLINNAIKFSGEQDRQGRVSVRAELDENRADQVMIEFQVIDNGIGIDETTQARLFTAFTQADSSTSRRFGGTGLGLAISQHLVGLMGGEIMLQSAPGQGTTFTVRLPFTSLQPEHEHESESESGQADINLAGVSCLLIPDSRAFTADLAAYLEHAGATVEQVTNLGSAKALRDRGEIDPRVWIIDDSDEHSSVASIQRALDGHQMAVVVSRGNRRHLRSDAKGIVQIDGNALGRSAFLQAVAMAAGRVQEETQSPILPEVEAVAALSREDALRQNRLILVAEDNETNQMVILHQLAMLGYTADVANNGREALDCWRSSNYALVLTDLQMPEVDGFELATRIRAAEQESSRIPIAALTANILVDEEEHCRAVGMDDYLSKPASLKDLRELLEKWLPAAEAEVNHTPATHTDSGDRPDTPLLATKPPVDVSVLEELVGKEPQIVSSFLQDFRVSASAIAAELRGACHAGQATEAAAAAHKLKSAALTVGALALGELCFDIEKAGRADQADLLADLLGKFNAELAAVDDYLKTPQ